MRLGIRGVRNAASRTGALGAGDPNQGWIEVRSPHFVVASNAGEKEARRIADQFEQIRALFHTAFPNLRVDPSEPVLILAAKKRKHDEDAAMLRQDDGFRE